MGRASECNDSDEDSDPRRLDAPTMPLSRYRIDRITSDRLFELGGSGAEEAVEQLVNALARGELTSGEFVQEKLAALKAALKEVFWVIVQFRIPDDVVFSADVFNETFIEQVTDHVGVALNSLNADWPGLTSTENYRHERHHVVEPDMGCTPGFFVTTPTHQLVHGQKFTVNVHANTRGIGGVLQNLNVFGGGFEIYWTYCYEHPTMKDDDGYPISCIPPGSNSFTNIMGVVQRGANATGWNSSVVDDHAYFKANGIDPDDCYCRPIVPSGPFDDDGDPIFESPIFGIEMGPEKIRYFSHDHLKHGNRYGKYPRKGLTKLDLGEASFYMKTSTYRFSGTKAIANLDENGRIASFPPGYSGMTSDGVGYAGSPLKVGHIKFTVNENMLPDNGGKPIISVFVEDMVTTASVNMIESWNQMQCIRGPANENGYLEHGVRRFASLKVTRKRCDLDICVERSFEKETFVSWGNWTGTDAAHLFKIFPVSGWSKTIRSGAHKMRSSAAAAARHAYQGR